MAGSVSASMTRDDATLLQAVSNGDAQAYGELVRRHTPRLLGLAIVMLRSRAEAEDAVQDVCLKIWQNPGSWKPGLAPFPAWLDRVTANRCIDLIRRRRPTESGVSEEIPDPAPDAFSDAAAQETQKAVWEAVNHLPERQRVAITLSSFQGHNNPTIARMMDISVEAVESLLARARRSLRENLREFVEGDAA